MRFFSNKIAHALLGLLILCITIPLIVLLVLAKQNVNQKGSRPGEVTANSSSSQTVGKATSNPGFNHTLGRSTPWPVISRNVPVFASSAEYATTNANNENYDASWRSNGTPAWLAYDLSSIPAVERSKVLLVWYNETGNYDHTLIGYPAYNIPQDYTVDVNPAAGGGSPPKEGWVTLATLKENHYHSRQHLIDMAGNNWIRMNVTAVDGSVQNYDTEIKMDVYDATYATNDDWIFYGDSITAGAMSHRTSGGVKSFAQLINATVSNRFPVQESGGTGFLTSADGGKYINTWLRLFPGKYVALAFGTNDALGCVDPDMFYTNYVKMVQAVINLGKIPVVPLIPWGRNMNILNCGSTLNARIDSLYKAFPQILKGPDLWTFFKSHQNLISNDNIHPTKEEGFGAYRQQWAISMLRARYIIPAIILFKSFFKLIKRIWPISIHVKNIQTCLLME
jgi:hypothetical protein